MNKTSTPSMLVFISLLSVVVVSCDKPQSNRADTAREQPTQSDSVQETSSSGDQTQSQTSLPPEAQNEVDKGLAAVQQESWVAAIDHFSAARRIAPYSPDVLLNQALAEQKAGGRQLRAIALFEAYLIAAPNAPTANQVRQQIDLLEAEQEDVIEKLLTDADDLALESSNEGNRRGIPDWIGRVRHDASQIGHIGEDKPGDYCCSLYSYYDGYITDGKRDMSLTPDTSDDRQKRIRIWTSNLDDDITRRWKLEYSDSPFFNSAEQYDGAIDTGISLGGLLYTDLPTWIKVGPSEVELVEPIGKSNDTAALSAVFEADTANAIVWTLDCEEKLEKFYGK